MNAKQPCAERTLLYETLREREQAISRWLYEQSQTRAQATLRERQG